MTAEVFATAYGGTCELTLPSYERPSGVHPPLDFAGYRHSREHRPAPLDLVG